MILSILFKSYSSYHINKLVSLIKNILSHNNMFFKGPIFLPKKTVFFNLLRSPHIDKDSRDQIGYSVNRIFFHIYNINTYFIKIIGKLDIPPIVKVYYKFY
ncbi:30S ribosomal protein S10 [Candidatus Vidania fulgoroideorum]